jgi:hypothetical protein
MSENKAVTIPQDNGSQYLGSNLPVTQSDFAAFSDQRKMLVEFVSQQLKKDVDYGIIPGTKK